MSRQDKKIPKKRGRPATGLGLQINVRLHDAELELVDRFRLTEPDEPSRPEAIRRLIDRGFTTLPMTVFASIEKEEPGVTRHVVAVYKDKTG